MVRPTPLLINPKAGSLFRSGLNLWLRRHQHHFRLIPTGSAEDLTAKARQLAESGEPVVAAAGGDGTLMCAAQGLIGSDSALGILPCGTMNVFARELGIGSRKFNKALEAIQGEKRQVVDIFAVNDRPFLQMAGFGLDARVIQLITPKLKKRMGAAAHIITGMQVAIEKPTHIHMALPNGEILHGTQIIMGNGKRYGGETRLFANARYDDGLLDAAIIDHESMGVLLEVLGIMVSQGATDDTISDFTELRSFESCDISADGPLAYQLDGDYAGTLQPGDALHICALPHKLKVCVPEIMIAQNPIMRLMDQPMMIAIREKIQALNEL